MMSQLTVAGLAIAAVLTVLVGVYLFATDQARRSRAWRLLLPLEPRNSPHLHISATILSDHEAPCILLEGIRGP
ncbi:hypothetical protein [Nonomuraea sp. NPDC049750]|uniref:hypothetical protein n=1 Tax=Nonomuraea sp. NPDC049750 TaxID=3154738 RepID=UPI0033CF0C86